MEPSSGMLQAAAGSLSLCLCSHTCPISQTGTAGVILLRMDVIIVRLNVYFGFTQSLPGAHVGWSGGDNGEGIGGVV